MKGRYNAPSDAVWNVGRKKARGTIAIKTLESVKFDIESVPSHMVTTESKELVMFIDKITPLLKRYRKNLDKV